VKRWALAAIPRFEGVPGTESSTDGTKLPLIRAFPTQPAAFASWAVYLLCNWVPLKKACPCAVAETGLTPAGKDWQSAPGPAGGVQLEPVTPSRRSIAAPFWTLFWTSGPGSGLGRAYLRVTGELAQLLDCKALTQRGNTVRKSGNAALERKVR
jgi:hypothetical protein